MVLKRKAAALLLILALCLTLFPVSALASEEPEPVEPAAEALPEAVGEPSAEPDEPAAAPTDEAALTETEAPGAAPEPAFDGAANEEIVYGFLTGTMGFNTAAACGIMGTIYGESRFDPNVTGDNSTSYGICQWHDWGTDEGRFTNLKNFCAQNGYDYHTLEGQLNFLRYELTTSWYGFSRLYENMFTFPDTAQGAYDAGYYWCKEFGRPADPNENVRRGEYARDIFYPKYAAVTCYTVMFDACGGSAVESRTVASGGAVGTLPATTREGYSFGGWYSAKNGGGTRLTADTAVTAGSTWYACWDPCLYFVSYDACGGTADKAVSMIAFGSAYGTLAAATRKGYRFDGWYTAAEGGALVTASTTVTTARNHILYAHWTKLATYTVSYDANGGSGAPMPQQKTQGAALTVTATVPKRSGYRFLGWAESPTAETAQVRAGDSVTADRSMTLYAVWRRLPALNAAYTAAEVLAGKADAACDADGSGYVTAYDAALILRASVGR